MFLKVLKFDFKQICIWTLFDHNSSFITPFELILFANRSSWPKLSDKAKFTNFGTVRNCFMLQELFAWFWCFLNCLLRSFWFFCMIAYVWLLLLAYARLTGVWRVELSGVMSANHLHHQYRQVHTLIILYSYPVFMH